MNKAKKEKSVRRSTRHPTKRTRKAEATDEGREERPEHAHEANKEARVSPGSTRQYMISREQASNTAGNGPTTVYP